MTAAQALQHEHHAATTGLFVVSMHVLKRQRERTVRRRDIRQALRTATKARRQENNRWRLDGGHDLDGDDLTLIVAFERVVVIVTVF